MEKQTKGLELDILSQPKLGQITSPRGVWQESKRNSGCGQGIEHPHPEHGNVVQILASFECLYCRRYPII